jgi:hypothetical protein
MPRGGFKPTNAVSELAKTVHTLDSAAAVIGSVKTLAYINREKI